MRHGSPWLAGSDATRYPMLSGTVRVDVVIVGGGITGLSTALLAQRDGAEVAVIEASRIASGTTGHTTGKVTSQHTLAYSRLVRQHGEEKARLYADANQRGVERVSGLVSELGIDCGWRRAAAYTYTQAPEQRGRIEEEAETAQRLGLPAAIVSATDLPYPVEVALRFDGQAMFDAGRYCRALAERFVADGGHVFEQSRATDIDETRSGVTVRTGSGTVVADTVVVATLLPVDDVGAFFAKARASRSYGLAARLRAPAPDGMYISVESPTRSIRPWPAAGENGVIVIGDSHETGRGGDTSGYHRRLDEWTRQVFEVESIDHRWSAQDYATVDGIPYIGRSPRSSRRLVATGFNKWGLSNGTAAAIMLSDLLAARDNPWLAAFDATRIGDAATVNRLLRANVGVAKRWVKGAVGRLRADSVTHLEPGDGGMVEIDGEAVGAYREPNGDVHAVRLTCTHMGCTLAWNGAETSWDCPCHGSRFSTRGEVLNGPAVDDLAIVAVDADDER